MVGGCFFSGEITLAPVGCFLLGTWSFGSFFLAFFAVTLASHEIRVACIHTYILYIYIYL